MNTKFLVNVRAYNTSNEAETLGAVLDTPEAVANAAAVLALFGLQKSVTEVKVGDRLYDIQLNNQEVNLSFNLQTEAEARSFLAKEFDTSEHWEAVEAVLEGRSDSYEFNETAYDFTLTAHVVA